MPWIPKPHDALPTWARLLCADLDFFLACSWHCAIIKDSTPILTFPLQGGRDWVCRVQRECVSLEHVHFYDDFLVYEVRIFISDGSARWRQTYLTSILIEGHKRLEIGNRSGQSRKITCQASVILALCSSSSMPCSTPIKAERAINVFL